MLLLTFPKQGGPLGRPGRVSACECARRGGGGRGRTPAWPLQEGKRPAIHGQGGGPGELRYAASQRHTEPSLRREFQSQGWRSRAVASQPPLPGQVTLGKSATHSGPPCPPRSLVHAPAALASPKSLQDMQTLCLDLPYLNHIFRPWVMCVYKVPEASAL